MYVQTWKWSNMWTYGKIQYVIWGMQSALLPSVSVSHRQALDSQQPLAKMRGREQQSPQPFLCCHGWVQARLDLLGAHMAAGTDILLRQCYNTAQTEGKNGKLGHESLFLCLWQRTNFARSDFSTKCRKEESCWKLGKTRKNRFYFSFDQGTVHTYVHINAI